MVACGTPQHPVGSGQGKLPAIDQREIKAVAFSLENNRTLLHFVVVVCVCVCVCVCRKRELCDLEGFEFVFSSCSRFIEFGTE